MSDRLDIVEDSFFSPNTLTIYNVTTLDEISPEIYDLHAFFDVLGTSGQSQCPSYYRRSCL